MQYTIIRAIPGLSSWLPTIAFCIKRKFPDNILWTLNMAFMVFWFVVTDVTYCSSEFHIFHRDLHVGSLLYSLMIASFDFIWYIIVFIYVYCELT